MYVTYFALSDEDVRIFLLLRKWALRASLALAVPLMLVTMFFGSPHGLEPVGWPFSPVDWYGWGLALLLAVGAVPAAVLVFAVQKLFINAKVRKNSRDISAVAYPLAVAVIGLLLFAVALVGRLLFVAGWTLPTSGWATGMAWSHGCGERIAQIGFSPEGGQVRVRLKSGNVRSWLVGRGKETASYDGASALGPISTPPLAESGNLTIDAGGTLLEFKGEGTKIRVLEGPGRKDRLLTGAAGMQCVALSGDGLLALSAGMDGVVRSWDLEKNQEKSEARGEVVGLHQGPAFAVASSGDKKVAISGGKDNKVRVWSMASKKQLGLFDGGHKALVKHVALDFDGKRAVSAAEDGGTGILSVWDVEAGKLLGQFEWRTPALEHLSMSPDGRYALTTDGDNLQLWRLP